MYINFHAHPVPVQSLDYMQELIFSVCKLNDSTVSKTVEICEEGWKRIAEFEQVYRNGHKLHFFLSTTNYVQCFTDQESNRDNSVKIPARLGIHQIVMRHFGKGNGHGVLTVDHIDRNRMNNKLSNLRLATKEEQRANQSINQKRRRRYNARELPEGLTEDMIPKYVTYCFEKRGEKDRHYFQIEGHPALREKRWIGSKSIKIDILEKLKAVCETLEKM